MRQCPVRRLGAQFRRKSTAPRHVSIHADNCVASTEEDVTAGAVPTVHLSRLINAGPKFHIQPTNIRFLEELEPNSVVGQSLERDTHTVLPVLFQTP